METSSSISNDSRSRSSLEDQRGPLEWCFDILLYCQTEPNCTQLVLPKLLSYANFSFCVNGVVTCSLFAFGLTGNLLLLNQIRHSRLFSRRLACHLRLLSLWDMMLLISCFITNGISSLYYKMTPTYGFFAYIVYFFQPLASFCVTCAIWQVSVITTERYMAVSHPFIHQSIKDRFKLKLICFTTVICSFLLNIVTIPVERELRNCMKVEIRNNKAVPSASIQLVQKEIMSNLYYAIFVYLIPDLLFRAPVPTILIAVLTTRTLLVYKRRRVSLAVRTNKQRSKSIPFMLTVLNLKFILCNTLYMFNTVLVEVMGYGRLYSSQTETNKVEHYVGTLYLSDLSNMLLALHSATNWLIFYNWSATRSTSSLNGTITARPSIFQLDSKDAEQLLSRFTSEKHRIGVEVIARLCQDSVSLREQLFEDGDIKKENIYDHEVVQAHGTFLGDFIDETLRSLAANKVSLDKIRERCREVGKMQYKAGIRLTTAQWKQARDLLLWCTYAPSSKWSNANCFENLLMESSAKKAFYFILAELKNGALFAAVDEKQQLV